MKVKRIKIYADGADYYDFVTLNKSKIIKGFTTNPTLMRKSGVKNYEKFAKKLASFADIFINECFLINITMNSK